MSKQEKSNALLPDAQTERPNDEPALMARHQKAFEKLADYRNSIELGGVQWRGVSGPFGRWHVEADRPTRED
ncbi:hypothetical protein AWB76_02802 [Caballeronia temeraria]|uniref:Uncharacterized protein n=1 Tax=Caballeronia temeraria TaxID=1777137 RepID=A0A158AP16_9BURK|nr:hypothetical protein [Caballeronia temeraria]SAK59731.1 hypothetical protein AWB76_02802 [Caballeronia temeraria]